MEWIEWILNMLQQAGTTIHNAANTLYLWFLSLSFDSRRDLLLTFLGCIWVAKKVFQSIHSKKRFPKQKRRPKAKHNNIAREDCYIDYDGNWLPPEHPKHPNNRKHKL